jgi:benzylsuccinate CoA-transferase BbsF subunit
MQALAGLKVADFTWVAAGPLTTRLLADHGATVVHIESLTKPDISRTSGPYRNDVPGLNRAANFGIFNAGKLGMTINLKTAEGRAVAWRLIEWADVVAENMTPGAMAKFGFDYESIRQRRPDIVMLSSTQQGQTGPRAIIPGYGYMSTAYAGHHFVTGWPDRVPVPPPPTGNFSDFISPPLGVTAILAAIDRRDRTGEGCYIDLSQFEPAVRFLATPILDFAVNGRVLQRNGNRDPWHCPHGVYPCLGDDRWIAITVTGEEGWEAFCRLLDRSEWMSDPRFSDLSNRMAHQDELDEAIAQVTATYDGQVLMKRLQEAGVAAGVVNSLPEVMQDPQLVHREHRVTLPHNEIGPVAYDRAPFQLSSTPGGPNAAAPCLGEHLDHVLRELLQYSDDEIADLIVTGAVE